MTQTLSLSALNPALKRDIAAGMFESYLFVIRSYVQEVFKIVNGGYLRIWSHDYEPLQIQTGTSTFKSIYF